MDRGIGWHFECFDFWLLEFTVPCHSIAIFKSAGCVQSKPLPEQAKARE
jgi:hypothetical protein